MSRHVIRWTGHVVLAATLLIAGAHFVYYLYHWEWVRAQIAGLAFVAGLVVAATRLVIARLDRMERTVTARLDAVGTMPVRTAEGRQGPPDDEPEFPWLDRETSPARYHGTPWMAALVVAATADQPEPAVFIPVLLGAGLAVSVVAGLVERVAAAVNGGTGGAARRSRLALAGALAATVLGLAVGAVWFSAHYRPAPFAAGTTELTVRVSTQTTPRPPELTVELIGRYCARNAIAGVTVTGVRPASADSAVLIVAPVLDDEAQRRYAGCIQDANLERHWLTVTHTALVPGEGS